MHFIRKIYRVLSQEGVLSLYINIMVSIKRRYFTKYMAQKKWKEATSVGENLVKIFPERIVYYQDLARCYQNLGNDDLATYTINKGLKLMINPGILIEEIESHFDSKSTFVSKYVYMGGEQNLGCIHHTKVGKGEVEKYLTKISTNSGFKRERYFYLEIYKSFTDLKEITPKLVNFMELNANNLILITMNRIDGTEPILNEKTIKEAVKANKLITSIKYSEIKDRIQYIDFDEDFDEDFKLFYSNYPNHPISALHSFVSIHKKSTNQQLFKLVFKRMKAKKYSSESYHLMKRLERVIFDMQLFTKINPEVHYSLQHGDFNTHNMLIDKSSQKLFIIDWGNMRIGPTWVDIAGFFGQSKRPFHIINEEYLLDHDSSNNLEPIEKLFFVFTLIITWFIVFTRLEFDEQLNFYLRPAVEVVESMALDIITK